ncbi:MAG: cobaltochelatase subunit CobN [Methanobacterium sp.]|jgi:cobaltochelatase CobN
MRRQVILLVTTFVFALTLCGAVSAENTTARGETGSIVDSESNLSQSPVIESPEVREGNSCGNTQSQIVISGSVADCKTKSEFPNVTVTAKNNDTTLATAKTESDGRYNLSFVSVDMVFNVTASYPGHIPSTREVTVSPNGSNMYGTADFELGKPKALFLFHSSINPIFATALVDCGFLESDMRLISNLPDRITDYDLVFIDWLWGKTSNLDRIRTLMNEAIGKKIPVIVTRHWTTLPEGVIHAHGHKEHQWIRDYWTNMSSANSKELLKYLGNRFLGLNVGEPQAPVTVIKTGIYHPRATQLFGSLDDYLEWYGPTEGKKTVGILFHANDYLTGDLEAVNALIKDFENKGIKVIPYFYEHEGKPDINKFLMKNGRSAVDAIVHYKMFGWSPKSSSEDVVVELEKLGVPIIKGVKFYGTYEEWFKGTQGIQASTIGATIVPSERDGMFDPVVISTKERDPKYSHLPSEVAFYRPIDRQVNGIVNRTVAWINLRHTPNPEKKVAIIYWHGEGKDKGAGAGHLDVYASLPKLLEAMKNDGYHLGDRPLPDNRELVNLIRNQGLNIGLWAPGELENLVKTQPVILVPLSDYMNWFNELLPAKKKEVIDMWGEPPGNIMVYDGKIVLPVIRFGNVILAPEPSRGYTQDQRALYHSGNVPPTHQYLAFYFWLQKGFGVDAAIHFGRHGTVAWLPGKTGPGLDHDNCWPAIVSGDIPVIYPFTIEGSEGLLPKRRQGAVMISHLTPPVTVSGLYGDIALLHSKIHGYETTTDESVKEEYRKSIIQLVRDLKLNEDLNINMDNALSDFKGFLDAIHLYLHDIESEFIPYGLHVFGVPPKDEKLTNTVQSLLGYEFRTYMENNKLSDKKIQELLTKVILEGISPENAQNSVLGHVSANMTAYLNLAIEYAKRINQCTLEINRTLAALRGGYIPPGRCGDPVINPDVLPTGTNFFSFDPREIPSEEAWKVGVKLAQDTLERYKKETGDYPKKIAFMLWATHTQQDKGVMEAAILYLLGVEPVPDTGYKNYITDVKLIENLTRPRIDVVVTTTALYQNMYRCRLDLLNKAVRLAAGASDTQPNFVRESSDAIYNALIKKGYSEENARRLSMMRVFSQEHGNHHNAMQHALLMSGTWDDEGKLAETYIGTFGNVHEGADSDTTYLPDLYRLNLDGSEIAMFRRIVNVNDLFSDDDYFGYFGGLGLTIRSITGRDPKMWIMNLENPDNPKIESLSESLHRDVRSTYFNPKWIKAMQEHGPAGAGQMTDFISFLIAWDITSPDAVTNSMWDEAYAVYIKDKHNLGLTEWFSRTNPFTKQAMMAVMLEAIRKDYWKADGSIATALANEIAQSIIHHGVSCDHHTCGNPKLVEWAMKHMDSAMLSRFKEQMYRATKNAVFAAGVPDSPATPGTTPGTPGRTPSTGSPASQSSASSAGQTSSAGADSGQAQQESGETGEEGQKAYEVAKSNPGASGIPDKTIIYAGIGLVSILLLLGAGFFRESILSFLGFTKK